MARALLPKDLWSLITFSPLDLLACIESAFATLRRGASGLCVNHRRARRARASHACAPLFTQPILHLLDCTCTNPARKLLVDCLPRWERLG